MHTQCTRTTYPSQYTHTQSNVYCAREQLHTKSHLHALVIQSFKSYTSVLTRVIQMDPHESGISYT